MYTVYKLDKLEAGQAGTPSASWEAATKIFNVTLSTSWIFSFNATDFWPAISCAILDVIESV